MRSAARGCGAIWARRPVRVAARGQGLQGSRGGHLKDAKETRRSTH